MWVTASCGLGSPIDEKGKRTKCDHHLSLFPSWLWIRFDYLPHPPTTMISHRWWTASPPTISWNKPFLPEVDFGRCFAAVDELNCRLTSWWFCLCKVVQSLSPQRYPFKRCPAGSPAFWTYYSLPSMHNNHLSIVFCFITTKSLK